jgi:hypothetical protein
MMYPPAPPPPPPPRRSHTVRTVLIAVGVAVALCCAGGSVAGYFIFRAVKNGIGSVGAARSTADTFLTHLEKGETDAAYDQLCRATRQIYTRERFADTVAAAPRWSSHSITGVHVSTINGSTRGTVQARLAYTDGSTTVRLLPLVPEGGWRICGAPY